MLDIGNINIINIDRARTVSNSFALSTIVKFLDLTGYNSAFFHKTNSDIKSCFNCRKIEYKHDDIIETLSKNLFRLDIIFIEIELSYELKNIYENIRKISDKPVVFITKLVWPVSSYDRISNIQLKEFDYVYNIHNVDGKTSITNCITLDTGTVEHWKQQFIRDKKLEDLLGDD